MLLPGMSHIGAFGSLLYCLVRFVFQCLYVSFCGFNWAVFLHRTMPRKVNYGLDYDDEDYDAYEDYDYDHDDDFGIENNG